MPCLMSELYAFALVVHKQAVARSKRQVVLSQKARDALRDSEEQKKASQPPAIVLSQPPAAEQPDKVSTQSEDRRSSPDKSPGPQQANGDLPSGMLLRSCELKPVCVLIQLAESAAFSL